MEVLIGIVLFLVLGVIIVLVSRDSDNKIGAVRREVARVEEARDKLAISWTNLTTSAIQGLTEKVDALEKSMAESLKVFREAAKEARHKAGIFEPYEIVAKECGVSEDTALALIKSVENDSNFALAAINAGIKLADVGATQQKICEIVTKAQGEVEAEEKKE